MVLFGEVREVEEVRKASRDRQRRGDWHRAQLVGERLERIVAPGRLRRSVMSLVPRTLGKGAHALDARE